MSKFGRVYPLTPIGGIDLLEIGPSFDHGRMEKAGLFLLRYDSGRKSVYFTLEKDPILFFFCKYQSHNHD